MNCEQVERERTEKKQYCIVIHVNMHFCTRVLTRESENILIMYLMILILTIFFFTNSAKSKQNDNMNIQALNSV